MRTRTARSLATYVDGRRIRTQLVEPEASVPALVRAELVGLDESAEVVVLDQHGHRLERWCRRGSLFVRDWALPGVVAQASRQGRTSSSSPPAPSR